jgi:hypothetical protein
VQEYKQDLARIRILLRDIEWCYRGACVICGRKSSGKHAPECWIGVEVGKIGGGIGSRIGSRISGGIGSKIGGG